MSQQLTLDEIGLKHGTDKASSHHDYLNRYGFGLDSVRDKPFRILEIGVQFGASIKTWLEYFPNAEVYGVDQLEEFKSDNPRYHFLQGDQRDEGFMRSVGREHGKFHWVIDDGCHCADAIYISFFSLWEHITPGGCYIIEDIFTLWHPAWVARSSGVDGIAFLNELVGSVQLHGKSFFGRPEGPTSPLSTLEATIESVEFRKGLCIVGKRL